MAGNSSAFKTTAKRTRMGSGPFLPEEEALSVHPSEPGTELPTPIAPHHFDPPALYSDPVGLSRRSEGIQGSGAIRLQVLPLGWLCIS